MGHLSFAEVGHLSVALTSYGMIIYIMLNDVVEQKRSFCVLPYRTRSMNRTTIAKMPAHAAAM